MLSIARAVLSHEPESTITLVYGNRSSESIMFLEEIGDLKDGYLGRFTVINVLSRERQDVDILNGRIDGARMRDFAARGLIAPVSADGIFLCGPGQMIEDVSERCWRWACQATGSVASVSRPRVRLRVRDRDLPKPARLSKTERSSRSLWTGISRSFPMTGADGNGAGCGASRGHRASYSCAGGMCCTCRCRVSEGGSEMALNFSLEPWEIEAGFTLACQTRPTSRGWCWTSTRSSARRYRFSRICVRVRVGVMASGSRCTSMIAGLPEARARSKAGPNSSVVSTVSPWRRTRGRMRRSPG